MKKKYILQLNYNGDCRNKCSYCSKINDPFQNMSVAEVIDNIEYFSSTGKIVKFILSGGEVYEDNRLDNLLKALDHYDLGETIFITSGLGIPSKSAKLINRFFNRIVLSITPDSIDYTNSGDFKEKIGLMQRLTQPKIQTNSVVHGLNLKYINNTVRILMDTKIVYPVITLVFPLGELTTDSDYLSSQQQVVPIIEDLIDTIVKSNKRPIIKGIPACYMSPSYRPYIGYTENQNKYYITKKRQFKNAITFSENIPFEKFMECSSCKMNKRCDGFWNIYLDNHLFLRPTPIA